MSILENTASKRRVVIIDDDVLFAVFLTKLVGTFGHDTFIKSDLVASPTYELRDSDIVFLDVKKAHVNGLDVLEKLARQNPKCEFVIMSADAESLEGAEKLLKQLDLGLLGVLEKPFRVADVEAVLQGA